MNNSINRVGRACRVGISQLFGCSGPERMLMSWETSSWLPDLDHLWTIIHFYCCLRSECGTSVDHRTGGNCHRVHNKLAFTLKDILLIILTFHLNKEFLRCSFSSFTTVEDLNTSSTTVESGINPYVTLVSLRDKQDSSLTTHKSQTKDRLWVKPDCSSIADTFHLSQTLPRRNNDEYSDEPPYLCSENMRPCCSWKGFAASSFS